ncbi:MFS transporter [Spirillospora sp. CA-253888]
MDQTGAPITGLRTGPAPSTRGGAGFRDVIALSGPALPVISFLARLPAAMCPIGSLLLVNDRTGSIATAGLVAGAFALGQATGGPLIGRLADRKGQRPTVLVASLANAAAIALLVVAAMAAWPPLLQGALALMAGLSVPQIGPLSRSRLVPLAKGDARLTSSVLSFDGTVDETSFVTGPALVGLLAVFDPAAGLLTAAGLVAVCGPFFALHRTAPAGTARRASSSARLLSPALCFLCAGMALQGMVFGSLQTGITELTEKLGQPGAAGLIYGLMGVPSALVGLLMTARPSRLALRTRWRLVIVVQTALCLPLLAVGSMWALALTVTVLGLTYAPNIITMFALTERVAPPERMGEAMALLGSGIILGTSAGAMASGRLAETLGHRAAFWSAVACAGVAAVLALVTASRRRYG